jgi:hypothetical protein
MLSSRGCCGREYVRNSKSSQLGPGSQKGPLQKSKGTTNHQAEWKWTRLTVQMKVINDCKTEQSHDEPKPFGVRRLLKFSISFRRLGGPDGSIM